MSIIDDTCDFCATYFDPMGNDSAMNTGKGLWDGQCRQGRDALFGHVSTERIVELLAKFKAAYAADPIDWNDYPKERTPQGYRDHMRRLDLLQLTAVFERVLADRAAGK
jgi:hypothetical protein